MKGDSLEGSAHTPMYNPNLLPLNWPFEYDASVNGLHEHIHVPCPCFIKTK